MLFSQGWTILIQIIVQFNVISTIWSKQKSINEMNIMIWITFDIFTALWNQTQTKIHLLQNRGNSYFIFPSLCSANTKWEKLRFYLLVNMILNISCWFILMIYLICRSAPNTNILKNYNINDKKHCIQPFFIIDFI